MSGGGAWAPGEWTDDTAMALALAESIVAHGLLDADDLARRYIAWATESGKGIGNTTRAALIGAADARDARARALAHYRVSGLAAGNGTVMRVTPIGLAARDLDQGVQAARADAALTHADPAAAVASCALCAALLAIRTEVDPLAAASQQAQAHPQTAAALAAVADRDEAQLARLAGSGQAGACWATLAVALYALIAVDDYEQGVAWAISLGGDTDTNAAVAGALLGARHGPGTIPGRWLEPLLERGRIERLADGL
jgi:ADP-ribosylglycohydrolase